MGILARFITVIQANLNALLNKAEDPTKILEQTIQDMEGAYRKAKDQVARSMADQKRLEKSQADSQGEVKKWQERAVLAVEKGDDTLAKEALRRKNEHARLAIQFAGELQAQTSNVASLKESLQDLETKIAEIKRKKNLLVSKQRRAEAQDQIYKTIEGINSVGALDTIQRMETKIEEMGNLADARKELSQEFRGDQLERKFQELGAGSPDVDAELLELKQRLQISDKGAAGPPAKR